MLFQIQQVGDFRPAPAVDALVVIAHHAKIAMFFRQQMDQLELRGVGVLVLVHHHLLIVGAAGRQRLRVFAEQPQGQQNEVVKIHRVAGVQGGLVAFLHMFGQGHHVRIGKHGGAFPAIFVPAQQAEHGAGVGLFPLHGNLGQDFFDGPQLFGFVVNDEVAFVPQLLNVLAQNPDAQGMEGADGGTFGLVVRVPGLRAGQELVDPGLHFPGGLVGEGDGQDVVRGGFLGDQVGDAEGDHARLAGAGAGQDQDRPAQGFHRLALLRVEGTKVQHRARSLVRAAGKASSGRGAGPTL